MNPVGQVIELVLWLFLVALLTRLVVDYIQMFARAWVPRGPALVVLEGVYTVTDPPIALFRKLIPPLRLGGMVLDLSLLLVLLAVYLLQLLNRSIWT